LSKDSISKHFLSIIPRQVWDLGVGSFNPFTTSQMIGLSKQELWLWDVNELNALSSTNTHTHTHTRLLRAEAFGSFPQCHQHADRTSAISSAEYERIMRFNPG